MINRFKAHHGFHDLTVMGYSMMSKERNADEFPSVKEGRFDSS